jgi:hypothetical protein
MHLYFMVTDSPTIFVWGAAGSYILGITA